MRMRTIQETVNAIKIDDPDTALTAHAIRKMVIDGTIPSVRAGNKYLVDIDRLNEYLFNDKAPSIQNIGILRAVNE